MASEYAADVEPQPAPTLPVDEKAQKQQDAAGPLRADDSKPSGETTSTVRSPPVSAPSSPPISPPATENHQGPGAADDYYSSRGKSDKFGNPIPVNRRASAMGSVYGNNHIRLPGDLGAKDPRRPRSPALTTLPGDLGPNDPRRPRSVTNSPAPPVPEHSRQASIEDSEGGVRLMKDPKEPAPEPEEHDDGDDDADADNDNDTEDDFKRGRGMKRPEPGRTTAGKAVNLRDESLDSIAESPMPKPDPTKGESMLSFQRDPKLKAAALSPKKRVHPSTAFDVPPSGASTPFGSEHESHNELLAAQKLSLTMSAIHSTPSAHRVIRQIIRGDYEHFQHEAEQGRQRQRMYLVATDLSSESEYALEWTIGTVLRDGDTLLAVYAVDEESGGGGGSGEGGVEIGHGADSVKDTAAIVQGLPAATNVPSPWPAGPSPLGLGGSSTSLATDRSASRETYGPAELERRKAIESITHRCVHFLRRTKLQVRVVVEVLHCKSPRHMITEVIDFLSPTLVVIGSRGQSNIKGVLLGSFSNYLVTKSSVPVMVARKKLRKHGKSVKRNRDGTIVPLQTTGRMGRFSNMIEVPKTRGLRVQGWDKVGID